MKTLKLHTNLKTLRTDKGLSMQALCDAINDTTGSHFKMKGYQAIEAGRAIPNIFRLKSLADYYEISIDELCFDVFLPKVKAEAAVAAAAEQEPKPEKRKRKKAAKKIEVTAAITDAVDDSVINRAGLEEPETETEDYDEEFMNIINPF